MRFPMSTGLDFMGVFNRMLVPQAVLQALSLVHVFPASCVCVCVVQSGAAASNFSEAHATQFTVLFSRDA